MQRLALYKNSEAILCKAYSNKTLEFGYVCASAVGNLIAGNLGYTVKKTKMKIRDFFFNKAKSNPLIAETVRDINETGSTFSWFKDGKEVKNNWDKFCAGTSEERKKYFKKAMFEIDATGYSVDELYQIEYAFEGINEWGNKEEELTVIHGLIAAIKALRQIHQIEDEDLPLEFLKDIKLTTSPHVVDSLVRRYEFLKGE